MTSDRSIPSPAVKRESALDTFSETREHQRQKEDLKSSPKENISWECVSQQLRWELKDRGIVSSKRSEKNCQSRMLFPAKLLFQNESKRKHSQINKITISRFLFLKNSSIYTNNNNKKMILVGRFEKRIKYGIILNDCGLYKIVIIMF